MGELNHKQFWLAALGLGLILSGCADADEPEPVGQATGNTTATQMPVAAPTVDPVVPPPGPSNPMPPTPPTTDVGMPMAGGGAPEPSDPPPETPPETPPPMAPMPGMNEMPPPETPPTTDLPEGATEPLLPQASGACPDFRSGSINVGGLSAVVEAGAPGATKGPLLFAWHGTGGSGRQAMSQVPASVRREITSQGGIIIAPSSNGQVRAGADVTFVLGVWYDGADLDFADTIAACAVENHNVDPTRIFTTGCSAGGLMAGTMAIKRSNYVAAAAPNSGGVAVAIGLAPQSPDRIPAVMTMHGGDDDNVIVNFRDTSNNLVNVLKPHGAFLVDCEHDAAFAHCGAPTALHEKAYEFMEAHRYGVGESPYADGLPAGFPNYCMIK